MIKKLKSKIFLLIMISLSIFVTSAIILLGVLNYTNTIRTTTLFMDRVSDFEFDRLPERDREEDKRQDNLKLEGVFSVEVRNSEVIENESESSELEEYALKIAKSSKEDGVIGKYLYKVMRTPQNTTRIVFMENENTITNLRKMVIYSAFAIILSIIIIYYIARKLSKIIVRPVEETFEKQKEFISDASHELKTPLAVIEANSDVLEGEIRRK